MSIQPQISRLKLGPALALVLALLIPAGVQASPTYLFRQLIPGAAVQPFSDETQSFAVPGSYTVPVPAGATSLQATLVGGGGGARFLDGGPGAQVTGTLSLNGISQVTVVVGGGGGPGNCSCGGGGGGGGLSALCAGGSCSSGTALLVAGGGGGGQGDSNLSSDIGLPATTFGTSSSADSQGGGPGGIGYGGAGPGFDVSGEPGQAFGSGGSGGVDSAVCSDSGTPGDATISGTGNGGFGGGGGGGLDYGGGGGGGGFPGGGGGDDGDGNPEGGNGGVSYAASQVSSAAFQLTSNAGQACSSGTGWAGSGGNGSVTLIWK